MSPTPDQLESNRRLLTEQKGKRERTREKWIDLDRAIDSVNEHCCVIVERKIYGNVCSSAGYLLDDRDGSVSLHPIIHEILAGGGAVQEKLFLMVGTNFDEKIEIGTTKKSFFSGKPILIKFQEGWVEKYYMCGCFRARGKRLKIAAGVGKNGGFTNHRPFMSSKAEEDPNIGDEVAVKEAMVIALANAAGINPKDESSAAFPLLLEQLKRIRAEEVSEQAKKAERE